MCAVGNRIIVLAAIFMFMGVPPVLASSVDAVTEVQRQLILKELQDKLQPPEPKKQSAPSVGPTVDLPRMPAIGAPRDVRAPVEPLLVAVYGIDDDLVGDIIYGSSIVSVRPGDTLDGWKIVDVFSARAIMEKEGERKELLLSLTGGSRRDAPGNDLDPVNDLHNEYDGWAFEGY